MECLCWTEVQKLCSCWEFAAVVVVAAVVLDNCIAAGVDMDTYNLPGSQNMLDTVVVVGFDSYIAGGHSCHQTY